MFDFLYSLSAHKAEIIQGLTGLVTFASVIANFTRTDKDNRAVTKAGNVIHFLAGNWFTLKKPEAGNS